MTTRTPQGPRQTITFRYALDQPVRWPADPDGRYRVGRLRYVVGRTGSYVEVGLENLQVPDALLVFVHEADLREEDRL